MSLALLDSLPPWPAAVQVHPVPGAAHVVLAEGITLRFDAEGRWRSIGALGPILQRTVDGRVALRRRERGAERVVEEVPAADAGRLHETVRRRVEGLLDAVAAGRVKLVPAHEHGSVEEASRILERARLWDAARFDQDRRRFQEIYDPVGILPPDHYRDVVLQPTAGCPWNRCSFCRFYRDQKYRVRSIEDFATHVRDVRDFFGRALRLRWGVFLGEANALALSQARLLEVLVTARDELAAGGLAPARHEDMGAFFDPQHSPSRTADDFRELAAAGLRSLAIGVETGCQELLDALGKGGRVRDTVDAVRAARAGGVRVAVIFLVGPGDERLAELHRRASVHAVQAMGLTKEDLVFLSPLAQVPGESYPFAILPEEDTEAEVLQFRHELASVTPAKISPYRMEEFQYYS